MKFLPLIFLTGCISMGKPVTSEHWTQCYKFCDGKVAEACVTWKGNGCRCDDNRLGFFDTEFD
jgi:hypothetical protein